MLCITQAVAPREILIMGHEKTISFQKPDNGLMKSGSDKLSNVPFESHILFSKVETVL